MENKITDLYQHIKELESGLIVLQNAVQNDNNIISLENIDNNLEIIIEKVKKIISLTVIVINDFSSNPIVENHINL